MAFQPVVDTAEINIIYSANDAIMQNVFYAALVGGYTLANLQALAAGIDGQVHGTWKPQQAIEAVYQRTEVRGLAAQNDLVAVDNTNAGVGTHVSSILPNNVTLAVKKESGFTGRSARGRTYWIGSPSAFLKSTNENKFNAADVTAIVAAVDSIRTQIIALALWSPVLVSRYTDGALRTAGELFPWITCSAVNEVVDTQRGRLP